MPFYDLRCKKCENEFRASASMSERTEKKIACPDCGGNELDAVFKTANFSVKNNAPACPNSHICGAGCAHAH